VSGLPGSLTFAAALLALVAIAALLLANEKHSGSSVFRRAESDDGAQIDAAESDDVPADGADEACTAPSCAGPAASASGASSAPL
jgi:hypothetical protein